MSGAHLHWHIAPLPPGVPYHRQQARALMAENGVLDVDDSTLAALARSIRSRLQPAAPGTGRPASHLRGMIRAARKIRVAGSPRLYVLLKSLGLSGPRARAGLLEAEPRGR